MTRNLPKTGADRYRVVTTYGDYELTIASVPMGRDQAMRLFAALLSSGSYGPHEGRRTRVLSVAECERWGYR